MRGDVEVRLDVTIGAVEAAVSQWLQDYSRELNQLVASSLRQAAADLNVRDLVDRQVRRALDDMVRQVVSDALQNAIEKTRPVVQESLREHAAAAMRKAMGVER